MYTFYIIKTNNYDINLFLLLREKYSNLFCKMVGIKLKFKKVTTKYLPTPHKYIPNLHFRLKFAFQKTKDFQIEKLIVVSFSPSLNPFKTET